jgi:teichuronic acid exporter
MFQSFRQSEFVRSVMVLMTGTVVAQAIAYLIYPILTQLYDAEDMADQTLYMRIVAFISVMATARYELTLPIAKRDVHAFHLYQLSFRIALVVIATATVAFGVYLLFRPVRQNDLLFLSLTILSAYLAASINLGTSWAVRTKQFRRISQQRVTNSLAGGAFKLLFGWFSWGGMGLVFGSFLAYLFSSVVFVFDFLKLRKQHGNYKTAKRMRVLSREYKQFPALSLPLALIDLAVDLAIASLVLFYYDKESYGLYSYALMILKVPLMVIGQSVGQVFMNKCSVMVNEGKSVVPLITKTFSTLFLLSIVPFTLLFFFGEELFAFVFGEEWAVAGVYASILSPALLLNFVLSPVSGMPLVMGRQKEVFVIGLINAVGQLAIFGALPRMWPEYFGDLKNVLWVATAFQSALFVAVFFVYLKFARAGRK